MNVSRLMLVSFFFVKKQSNPGSKDEALAIYDSIKKIGPK